MPRLATPALLAVLLANSACAQQPSKEVASHQAIPRVHLLYPAPDGTILDIRCREFTKQEIEPALIQEAIRQLPEFRSRWEMDGPKYLQAALDEVGNPYPYQEMQAVLTVCLPSSISIPLVINVRPYLPSLKSAPERRPDWRFAHVIFHELMHTYVYRVANTSEILRRYTTEPPVVVNHLHVMALEKLVLQKLGRTAELKSLDKYYRSAKPTAAYKRAWEIVNDIEGHTALIDELRAMKSSIEGL